MKKYKTKGWYGESERHRLARFGVKTKRGVAPDVTPIPMGGNVYEYPAYAKLSVQVIKSTRYVGDGFEFTFMPIEDSIDIIKTKDGYEARYLVREDNPQSPDDDDDEGLFLVHYHRDFQVDRKNIITEDDARDWYQGKKIPQEKDYWILPVEAYIHHGVHLTLDTHKGMLPQGHYEFDTSRVGLVLASKKEFDTKEKAEKAMRALIEGWNQYLIGDVYGVVKDTYDKNKKLIDNDAVWGYYGYEDAMSILKDF